MVILMKLSLNSKLNLFKSVKQLFRIQIKKSRKVLLWEQVKSIIEACYSELVLHSLCPDICHTTFLEAKPHDF